MVREMPRYLRCQHLALDAFEAGAWIRAQDAGGPAATTRADPTNGAQVAARMIAELVSAT